MHRIVYSLLLELEPLPDNKPGVSCCLIVPLDRAGMAAGRNGRPRPPKLRTIDLRVGDEFICCGQWRKIIGIEAYRAMMVSDEHAANTTDPCGYIYRVPEPGEVRPGR